MANVSSSNGLDKRPKLRFPGFDEPYKQCCIGDIYAERSQRGASDMELLSVTMNDGVMPRSEIEGKDNSSEDKSNYKVVLAGDMVYNSMRMWQGANGISPCDGIVSPAYTVLMPKIPISNGYVAALFKSPNVINEFRKNSQGMTSDTWNLKDPQIETIKVNIPTLPEQERIANMLGTLDRRIAKQTLLVDSLKKYKRGVIQQAFSQENENSYFTKWEASYFGDFFTEQSIRTSNSPDTPLVSLTVEDGVTPKTERYYREFLVTKDGDNYKAIKPGWFAYNPMNAHLGAIAPNHLGYTAAVSGYYNIFSVNEAETICFWEEYLKSYPMLIHYKLIATGSLIEKQRVHYSQFVNIRRSLPSVEEQKHLSKMFKTLNTKIANAENMERQLVRMRIALLQQLFI